MKPSATLDRVDVKEMGLRSLLMSSIVDAVGRGGTSAIFQARGTLHSEKEVLRISAIGAARISAYSFNNQFGRSSGPPARAQLCDTKENCEESKKRPRELQRPVSRRKSIVKS